MQLKNLLTFVTCALVLSTGCDTSEVVELQDVEVSHSARGLELLASDGQRRTAKTAYIELEAGDPQAATEVEGFSIGQDSELATTCYQCSMCVCTPHGEECYGCVEVNCSSQGLKQE